MADEREKEFPRELREYIEAERKASFAAGYAEAKREAFEASFVVPPKSANPAPKIHQASTSLAGRGSLSADSQMARGMPELYIEEEYRAIAPNSARAIDIRHRIKEARGVDLPTTTLHRAISRLSDRGVLERIGNTSAWRYVKRQEGETGSSNDESEPPGRPGTANGNGAMPLRP